MRTLFAYGTCLTDYSYKSNYTFWPELVANELNYNFVNSAKGASDNVISAPASGASSNA